VIVFTVLCSFIIALSSSLSCKSKSTVRYYSREKGFSIEFPKDWKIEEGIMGTAILARVPQVEKGTRIKQNLNVTIQDKGKIEADSLEEFMERQLEGIKKLKSFKELTIHDEGYVIIDKVRSKWYICSYSFADRQVKMVVYILKKGTLFYLITGLADFKQFDIYMNIFNDTARSFRFEH
jgi:hypothetical protein